MWRDHRHGAIGSWGLDSLIRGMDGGMDGWAVDPGPAKQWLWLLVA